MNSLSLFRRNNLSIVLVVFFATLAVCSTASALQQEEKETVQIFEDVSPSVVFIKNAALQWDWFSTYLYEIPQGAGSGFFWDEEGHIVTNFHVIYKANKIDVILANQETYPAKIVGMAADYDLAVIKADIPKELLKPILKGQSGNLKVGQKALSIGNPFGLDYSLTSGVVSALGRTMDSMTGQKIHEVIQTDAAINPGSSGGPIVNSSGELIGVAAAIFSTTGTSSGIGFAIPVDTVKRIVPQLIRYGKVKRVGLGITLVPDYIRSRLGINGALILEVQKKSVAEKVGFRPTRRDFSKAVVLGDIIIQIDHEMIGKNEDLIDYLNTKQVDDQVKIKYLRGGKEYVATVALEELQD